MPRIAALLILFTLMTFLPGLPALAQEATPAATPAAEPPVSARSLAVGSFDVLAPGTATLSLGRFTLAPGATLSFDPQDPAAVLVYAASGELTFHVAVPMTIARKADAGARGDQATPAPMATEAVAADTDFTLRDGDSALFPPAIAGEVRNDGRKAAIAWVVNVALQPAAAGTPTP